MFLGYFFLVFVLIFIIKYSSLVVSLIFSSFRWLLIFWKKFFQTNFHLSFLQLALGIQY
jgi:hypothetical protein